MKKIKHIRLTPGKLVLIDWRAGVLVVYKCLRYVTLRLTEKGKVEQRLVVGAAGVSNWKRGSSMRR